MRFFSVLHPAPPASQHPPPPHPPPHTPKG
jgi:hypothetical protein